MKTKLLELIDFEKVDVLLEGFNKTTGFVTAILDLEGNVLSKSGWRQMCTDFHRINPETSKKCTISDTELAGKLAEGEKYHFYKCLNGLVDVAVPVVINGEHIANLFSGQFFFEEPDRLFFKKQAEKYGFNEKNYLEALEKVPVVSKEKVHVAMDFLLNMTQLISEMLFQKLEQTESNKAIKEKEKEYRNLIEFSPVAMTIIHNWKTIYFNPAAVQLFGAKTEDELIGRHIFEFIHPDFHELAKENAKLLAENGYVSMQEQKYVKLDGTELDVETQAKSIRFNDDAATLVVMNDITERKKAEKALYESKKMLEQVIDSIPQFIFWKDRNSVYLGCNENFAHVAGVKTSNKIAGKTDYDLSWEKEEADFFVECDKRVMDSGIGEYHIIEPQLQADGKQAWLETNKAPILDESGQVIGILGTYEDITERKKAEETIQKSEENLSITLHSIGDGVISTDINGLIVNMNPVAEKLCGWKLTDALVKPLNEVFKIINAETRQPVADPVEKVLENGEIVGLANHTVLISKDGAEYQIADSAAPIKNKDGEINGVVLVFSDITEKYAADKQIKKSEERYSSLLNNLEAGIVVHAPDTSIVMSNQRAAELLGLSDDQMRGKVAIDPAWKFVNENYMPLTLDEYPVNRIANSMRPIINQVLGIHQPGKNDLVWLNVNGFPVLDNKGEITEIVISFIDITERKRTEEEYFKFFTITQNSLYGSAIVDPEGNIVYVNDYFAQIHGYTVNELIGRKLDVFHSHTQMSLVMETIEKAMEKGNIESVEIFHLHKNRHEFPMLMSLAVINDSLGKTKYIAATAFDLTEQKTIQKKLQDTVNDQNVLLNNDPTLIYFKDCDNNIIRVTESVAKATGLTREEIEGRPSKEIYPNMADQYWEDDLEVIKTGNPKCNIIEPLTGIDGSIHWLLTTKVPVKNDSGVIVGISVFATDITHLKNTELELIKAKEHAEESESKFRQLAENVDEVFWIRTDDEMLYVSPAFEKIWGYSCQMLYDNPQLFTQSIYPDDKPAVMAVFESDSFKRTGIFDYDYRIIRNNDEIRWISAKSMPILDKNGNVVRRVGIAHEITERKKAEETLLESEERYKALHNASFGGIAIHDKGKILECNQGLSEITGYSYTELIGMDGLLLIAPNTRDLVLNNILAGYEKPYEAIGIRKNGELFPLRLEARNVPYKGKNVRIVEFRDITERKYYEKIQNIQIEIATAVVASDNIEQLLEFVRTQLSQLSDTANFFAALYNAQTDTLKKLLWVDEVDSFNEWDASKSFSGYVVKTCKTLLLNKQEISKLSIEQNIPILGKPAECWLGAPLIVDKRAIGVLVIQSYTDPKAYDASFTMLFEQIAYDLGAFIEKIRIIKELNIAKLHAEESDRLKSAFLANMSHEVRTPLNSIVGFSELLNDNDFDINEKKEFIQLIIRNGNNLLNIISDIVDISKIEAGQITIRKGKLQIDHFFEELKIQHSFTAEEKHITFNTICLFNDSEKDVFVIADKERLHQVFNNLISNALKFTSQGFIEVGYKPSGDMVEFHVKDSGIGIPKEFHNKIFDRFRQVEDSRTRRYGGNGLGLAITKNLIELMGGKIWLESEPDKGSIFYFTLPKSHITC